MAGRNRRYVAIGHNRANNFSRSLFWSRQKTMCSASAVLLSFSFYNVRPCMRSGLLEIANFLVLFVILNSHNLLWTGRWERFGMLIVV